MKKMCLNFVSILLSVVLVSSAAQAQEKEKVSKFLYTCLYGTATGALLGVASLAFANDPAGSMSNIARGASLGLYAGIGIGLYQMDQETPAVAVVPKIKNSTLEGASLLVTLTQF